MPNKSIKKTTQHNVLMKHNVTRYNEIEKSAYSNEKST